MKILAIEFYHDVWCSPYKVKPVEKGFDELISFAKSINAHIFVKYIDKRYTKDACDEWITINHTFDLTYEQKKTLVDIIRPMHELLRSEEKLIGTPEMLITFERKDEENYFAFIEND